MNKIYNPVIFQGNLKKRSYFEGWYYKQASAKDNKTIAFIPGISLNEDDSHAFIQVIESPPIKTHYFRFEVKEFLHSDNPFMIRIGSNYFSEKVLKVNLKDSSREIKGELNFGTLTPIEYNFFMPNIMGPFAYIPRMACNHGIISMNHIVNGEIELDGKKIGFAFDKGYIEKDWGTSFPQRYIWLQGNNFESSNDSFMLSIAKVPFLGASFTGLIAIISVDSKEYRIATYNGGKISNIKIREDGVDIVLTRSNISLKVSAYNKDEGKLKAPIEGKMLNIIKEGLGGRIYLELTIDNVKVKELVTEYAGIEVVGDFCDYD